MLPADFHASAVWPVLLPLAGFTVWTLQPLQVASLLTCDILRCLQVFTPLQYGRAVAFSGPHGVDAAAIASCLGDELKARGLTDSSAIEQLAVAAPAYRERALLQCR